MGTQRTNKKTSTAETPSAPRGRPSADQAPAARLAAFEADRPAREALPAKALRGRPRGERVPAIETTVWQILVHAAKPSLAARLAGLEDLGELPKGLVGELRTALLAFEHAAARAGHLDKARVAPASAGAALPHARGVFDRLFAGAEFYWGEDDPAVRAALDGMKPRGLPGQLARHLGTLERLIRARIDELGPKTGRLKLEDLDAVRDLRTQLRPGVDPSLDPDQVDEDLERAYARLDRLYGELAAGIGYLERHNGRIATWPSLGHAGSKPRKRKPKAAPKTGAAPEGAAGAPKTGAAPEGAAGAPKTGAAPEGAAGAPKAVATGVAKASEAAAVEAPAPGAAPPDPGAAEA